MGRSAPFKIGHVSGACRKARFKALAFGVTLSGKKKQHKHKLFGPDFPRTFLTLTPECPGVEKFLPTTGAAGKRTFWCGRPRFSARTSMTRRVVEKLCTEKVCVDFLAPTLESREGSPPQKPPTPMKRVCVNSLRGCSCRLSSLFP